MAVDHSDRIYVTDEGVKSDRSDNRIHIFSSSGSFITQWEKFGTEDGKLRVPIDITVGPQGNIHIADYWNHNIQTFTQSGV